MGSRLVVNGYLCTLVWPLFTEYRVSTNPSMYIVVFRPACPESLYVLTNQKEIRLCYEGSQDKKFWQINLKNWMWNKNFTIKKTICVRIKKKFNFPWAVFLNFFFRPSHWFWILMALIDTYGPNWANRLKKSTKKVVKKY